MAAEYVPYTGPIVTYVEAVASGLRRYFTGIPCRNGHVALRITKNRDCAACYRNRRLGKRYTPAQKAAAKVYRAANLERTRIYKRAYYAKNAAKITAQTAAGIKRNPEPARCRVRNYKARKRAASGRHSKADVVEILYQQRGRCAYCRRKLGDKYSVDHIIALAAGGTNERRNLQITCQPCNSGKRDKDPVVYARWKGLLI